MRRRKCEKLWQKKREKDGKEEEIEAKWIYFKWIHNDSPFFKTMLNLRVWISCSINQKQKPKSVQTNFNHWCFLPFMSFSHWTKRHRGIISTRVCVFFMAIKKQKLLVCIPSCPSLCRQQVNPFACLAVKACMFYAQRGFMPKQTLKVLNIDMLCPQSLAFS